MSLVWDCTSTPRMSSDTSRNAERRQISSFIVSLLITYIIAQEIDFEIGHFCNFQTSVTLTLDRAIQHTVVYQSPTSSTYRPNVVEIVCGWTDRVY